WGNTLPKWSGVALSFCGRRDYRLPAALEKYFAGWSLKITDLPARVSIWEVDRVNLEYPC
ncbi:hypothetical protein, partial [Pseudomonas aeruginosa]|uniref:hypothetical protein n=1 Tax=Pseudomonas aeruginosa TaxID=287 RepID=UPI001E338A5A